MPDKLPPAEPSDEERHALTHESIETVFAINPVTDGAYITNISAPSEEFINRTGEALMRGLIELEGEE